MIYKLICVGGLESLNAPRKDAAAGNTRWHRKIVVEQGQNTFAFHLWGEKAMNFKGKVGDRITLKYTSSVRVSRTGVYHENLTITEYQIYRPGVRIPALKPWMLDIYRAAHLTEDDLEIVYPSNAKTDGEIGIAGVDYPDEPLDLVHKNRLLSRYLTCVTIDDKAF